MNVATTLLLINLAILLVGALLFHRSLKGSLRKREPINLNKPTKTKDNYQ